MCGICGIIGSFEYSVMNMMIGRMTTSLMHRGPDDQGTFVDSRLALGHTRLSIIDLSPTGHQPMQTLDGAFTIVFNGEVYNYKQLRLELVKLGYTFRGSSDTEVVLNSFKEWGVRSFSKLEGMFGMAI